MTEWVAALQDTGKEKGRTRGKTTVLTTVFEKIQKVACQIAKA
jgi:hypothetical protein